MLTTCHIADEVAWPSGISIRVARAIVDRDGAAAGQEVFHSHLHVIPRFSGGRLRIKFLRTNGAAAERKSLDDIAARLRKGLG